MGKVFCTKKYNTCMLIRESVYGNMGWREQFSGWHQSLVDNIEIISAVLLF